MTRAKGVQYATNSTLDAVVKGIAKQDYQATKCAFNELVSKQNAYKQVGDEPVKWNMITYKKGQKSTL